MSQNISKKIALRAVLVALAFILSWVEAQIPPLIAIPGIKPGLANLVVLIALYRLSLSDAIFINIIRILLVNFTFGSLMTFFYSLAGAALSLFIMYILKRYFNLSIMAVSVCGGISHNVGQLFLASIIVESIDIFYLLPYLWITGIITGALIGLLSGLITTRIKNILHE